MKNGRLYQSPEIDLKELLTKSEDILAASNPIDENDGFWTTDYDLSGKWW